MKVAIACGGTGGHLFPGLAVAEELNRRGHQTLLLVSSKQIDAIALSSSKDQPARALPGMGWPGISPKIFSFVLGLFKTRRECRRVFNEFKPDAVLGMGGFTSAIPLMLGKQMKLATFLHDSNAYPGRVTRLLAKSVTKVLLGFATCAQHLRGATWVVTGTPVRAGMERKDRDEAAAKLGMQSAQKTLLVMGGSQGARGVNEVILKMLPLLSAEEREQWQFLHLTGQADANIVEINYRRQRLAAKVEPFSTEMEWFYSLADLVLARSGASSLTEISHFELPSILIPYPTAADDHQTLNARVYTEASAAVAFPQKTLTPELLRAEIARFFNDDEARHAMGAAARGLAGENAAQSVAMEIEAAVAAKGSTV